LQEKINGYIATLLGMLEKTVKKYMGSVFDKLVLEGRNAATVRALEILSVSSTRSNAV
jgi:DNA-binding NarL/FixJ family response regulator